MTTLEPSSTWYHHHKFVDVSTAQDFAKNFAKSVFAEVFSKEFAEVFAKDFTKDVAMDFTNGSKIHIKLC